MSSLEQINPGFIACMVLNSPRHFLMAGALATALFGLPGVSSAQSAARQAGYLYLSPVPGASYVSPQTRYVLVRLAQAAPATLTNLSSGFISVMAQQTGPHPGTAHLALDGRTIIFAMGADFAVNEMVTVTLTPQMITGSTALVQPFQYQFMVAAPIPGSSPTVIAAPNALNPVVPTKPQTSSDSLTQQQSVAKVRPRAVQLSNGVSVPSDFPQVVISANNSPSPGYVFLENALDGVSPYTMMVNNNGLPVWYRRGRMWDFKVQPNGSITFGGYNTSGAVDFSALDQNFNPIRNYAATNGYLTDVHELKVLPDGTYFLIGDHVTSVNMGLYIPGAGRALVQESVIQEFTSADELIFQWRAWDNYDIRDLWPPGITEFVHMNAIDIDTDGNILVSARHLSEVTKIDRDSGAIIWRLGGAHNSFTFANDSLNGPSYQHQISALGNDHYMVFDNGDYHSPQISRAVEYQLDPTNMTATLVWQFRDAPDKYAWYCGSAQRLPTGNTFIDFVIAGYPKATEVDSNGVKHFELSLVPSSDSYRAFRFPWNGVVAAPYLIAEAQPDNISLIFNKFGDTNVTFYRIYGGLAPQSTNVLAESTGTLKQLNNLPNGFYYFRVTAVNSLGVESPFSNEESMSVNFPQPGQNTVQNGTFSIGPSYWTLKENGAATAGWFVSDGTANCHITNGGSSLSSVQLVQGGQPLLQGKKYVLDFDTWSDQARYIQVQLNQSPAYSTYASINSVFLTPNLSHYRYVFTMEHASDFNADLVFNLGTLISTVYIKNVSLLNAPPGDVNLDGTVDVLDLSIFSQGWLKQQTGAPADLNGDGKVDFNDLTIMGANWNR
jgi:hypothetical protein